MDEIPWIQEILEPLLNGEKDSARFEKRYICKDGSLLWADVSVSIMRNEKKEPVHFITTIIDISERKKAEDSLKENEAFIKTIMDNLPIGIAVNSVDPGIVFNYMNDNFPAIYRTTREALSKPDNFWNAVYDDPHYRQEISKRVLDDLSSGDPDRMQWDDIPITRGGEEIAFISARNIPVPGKPLMISTVWDTTKRKRAENKLARSEKRFRSLFENMNEAFVLFEVYFDDNKNPVDLIILM
ncbi:MAG: PAS domain S-box protein, partial [Methanosarcina sp.]|nr:PAS domain S-box protein [Methanosarcina sp.]